MPEKQPGAHDSSAEDNMSDWGPLSSNGLSDWPELGQHGQHNWDDDLHEYPSKKSAGIPGLQIATLQNLQSIRKRVQVCIDVMEPTGAIGNIVPLIADGMFRSVAMHELVLLPKIDYVHPYYNISAACKAMLLDKIDKAKKQHAHNLALTGKRDIVVGWKCPKLDNDQNGYDYMSKRVTYLAEPDEKALSKAWAYHYKELNWDCMHANKNDKGKRQRPFRRGGFYAVVEEDLFEELKQMADESGGKIEIHTIIAPKLMEAEPKKIWMSGPVVKHSPTVSGPTLEETTEHKKRKANTYANARQQHTELFRGMDFHSGVDFRSHLRGLPATDFKPGYP